MGLISAFSLGHRAHIALVGGGGKTTLMRSLAIALSASGSRVIATTTTKVSYDEALGSPLLVWCDSTQDNCIQQVRKALQQHGWIFVGSRSLESNKVKGIAPSLATALFHHAAVDYVIVEADGASGRPVKVPGEDEPVIPDSVTLTIAIMGLEALGKALEPDIAFRGGRIKEITGLQWGDLLSAEILAKLFTEEWGLFRRTPEGAQKMVFLNKLDLLSQDGPAHHLAKSILKESDSGIERVVIGSLTQDAYTALEGNP